jgi:two-component system response regulator (stage 0 sporulation protein F)
METSVARILFIDDDESIRFLVQEELGVDGHNVQVAGDGLTGLALAEQERPDLVILDLKMPGIGGMEVLQRLKKRFPDLPVFLFTAYDDYHREAGQSGADGYYVKSADLRPLKEAILATTAAVPC